MAKKDKKKRRAKAPKDVHLGFNQSFNIVLPDKRKVFVELSYLEPMEQLPELDIVLPGVMCVNNWQENMRPAPALDKDTPHVRKAESVVIPLEGFPIPVPSEV